MSEEKKELTPLERLLKAAHEAMDKLQAEFGSVSSVSGWDDADSMQVFEDLYCAVTDVEAELAQAEGK